MLSLDTGTKNRKTKTGKHRKKCQLLIHQYKFMLFPFNWGAGRPANMAVISVCLFSDKLHLLASTPAVSVSLR